MMTSVEHGMRTARPPGTAGTAIYRTLKRPFFGRFMKPWRWPEGVAPDRYERVRIASRSGASLHGLVRLASAPARGVAVLAHPMGLAAKGFWLKYGHADLFTARGYHVVAFDFNGFGESPSSNFDYPGDLISTGHFARGRFPRLPVFAIGASFGSMRSLEAASEPGQPFAAVVAEAAAANLPDFWKHYPVAYALLQASRVIYPPWERRLRPEYLLARAASVPPLLLIHSRADRWTPPAFGDRIAAAVQDRGRVERLIVDGAEHTHALRDARAAYTDTVFSFLDAIEQTK